MKENNQYPRKKRVILDAALRDMFLNGYDAATIHSVARAMRVNFSEVADYFDSDDFLRISAVHYAAQVWCIQVKNELNLIEDQKEKFSKLVFMFVNGAQNYSHSLRLYVSIWEKLNEKIITDVRVKMLLNKTYNLYQELFYSLFTEWYKADTTNKEKKISSLAWTMVVISDGVFIQQLLNQDKTQIKEIGRIMYEMSLAYIKSEGF